MASHSSGEPGELPTNSLDRAIAMLDLLRSRPKGLTHAELCRALGLPSSTCSYITSKLERAGYLGRKAETKRFYLGLKTVSLARTALLGLGFRAISEPVLYRITAETGLSAGIGVQQGGRVLLVDHVDGPDVVSRVVNARRRGIQSRENRDIGRELPLHATALGKVLLANMREAELSGLLERLPVDRVVLRRQLAVIRRQGFAVSEGEYYSSVRALAVPVRDAAGGTQAALSLNGRPEAAAWRDQAALVGLAESAAREIARSSAIVTG